MEKILLLILGILLSINLVFAPSVGISEMTEGKVVYTPSVSIFNNQTGAINTSNFWDSLDDPSDILMSLLNNDDGFAHYQFLNNNFNGSGSFTTAGNISLEFGDLISEMNPDGADAIRIKGTDYIDVVIGGMTGLFAVWNVADDTPVFYVDERGDTDIAGDLITAGDGTFEDVNVNGDINLLGATSTIFVGGGSVLMQRSSADNTIFRVARGVGAANTKVAGFYLTNDGANPFTSANSAFGILAKDSFSSNHMFVSDGVGNQLVLTNIANRVPNHDHATQTNPTFYIHSDTNPDTDNTQWINFYHDKTEGEIRTGLGDLHLNPIADLRISADVGIGTASPTHELNVVGDANITGNITSENVFIPQYLFSHTNATIPVRTANNWTNITFDQEDTDVKQGVSHTYNDATNHTFTIVENGIYNVDYDLDVEDISGSASDINVAARLILSDGTEVLGSVFEIDITRQAAEAELSHNFLVACNAGDVLVVQFIADDPDVQVSTHGTFGDHPESATLVINKIANL